MPSTSLSDAELDQLMVKFVDGVEGIAIALHRQAAAMERSAAVAEAALAQQAQALTMQREAVDAMKDI